jgi:tetratricopeptide (TPR) repeat protein
MTEERLVELTLRADPAERAALLDRECAGNPQLRARIESLLEAHTRSQPTIDTRFELTESFSSVDSGPGTVIADRYTLEQKLGEGGMGEVWVAKQSEPVKRKVALKLIKAGMDSRAVLQRFEAERQALAVMDHPNIAKVLDGGMTADRRPFFVMELVNGLPLTRFCDEAKLEIRDRLQLFVAICQAVQHAHQKGIVHRDLKPSNILVSILDGQPIPKIIDFGVAKAIGGRLTDDTLTTQFGAVIGTLEYMSPEQAGYSAADIDTRADIYSLGVILYELLTGLRPIDSDRLRRAALLEMIRIIQEEEPSKPSNRFSTANSAPTLAALRHCEPKKLAALLRGELDWVVMKCLEKKRDRRYETANALARDIQRYLADEPVEAQPPSAGYRLRKFVHRNRGKVIAASLLLVVLLAGIFGTTWGLFLALAAADSEKKAKVAAEHREAETKAVLDFVENRVFSAARPEGQEGGLGHDVTLRRALQASVPFITGSFQERPLIEARLRLTLGTSFQYLDEAKPAAEHQEMARTIYTRQLGADHPDTLQSMHALAGSYYMLGRFPAALHLREETLALRKTRLGPNHRDTLKTMHDLATSYYQAGRISDAQSLFESTLELQKANLGRDNLDTLTTMNMLAVTYYEQRQHEAALNLWEDALALAKARLPRDHHTTLGIMSNLGNSYATTGRHADALKLREETLGLLKAKFGPTHEHTLNGMNGVALSYDALGRRQEAAKLWVEMLAITRDQRGSEHPQTQAAMNNLGICYHALGRFADAVKLQEELVLLRKAKPGPDHPDTLGSMFELGRSYAALGRTAEGLKLAEEALAKLTTKRGPTNPETLLTMSGIAWILATAPDVKLRDPARAVQLAKSAAEGQPQVANYWGVYGTALYRTGDWNAAAVNLNKAINLRTPTDSANADNGFFLALAYWQLGEKEKAREWYDKGVQWMQKDRADDIELKRFRAESAELLGAGAK